MTAHQPVKAFCSYASKDTAYRLELDTHLAVLTRGRELELWNFGLLVPGVEWDSEIQAALAEAELVLFLVSPDFLASSYSWEKELTFAWKRHEENRARLVPIIVRPCEWRHTVLQRLQCLPAGGKPIVEWANRDAAWQDVTQGIRRVIAALRAR